MGKVKEIFTQSKKFKQEYCCSIVRVGEVKPIPNSDFLGETVVNGFGIVVRKDEVKEGDVLVYAEIETTLNSDFLSMNNLYELSEREHNENFITVKNLLDKGETDEAKKLCGYFDKHGRVKITRLRGVVSKGFLFGVDSLAKWDKSLKDVNLEEYIGTEFDEINGELFVKAYVPKTIVVPEKKSRSKKRNKRLDRFDKMIPGEFSFHYDTNPLQMNMWRIKPTDVVDISVKAHGTSFIGGNIKMKYPKKIFFLKKWINKGATLLGMKKPFIDYFVDYGIVYSSRNVIRNQFINEKANETLWSGTNPYEEYGKKLAAYIPKGMLLYGEICGYETGLQKMHQQDYDYGCREGESFLMPYRIVTKNEDGTKKEWNVSEVNDFTKEMISFHPELEGILKPLTILYHGTLQDLYPDVDTENHWHEEILKRLQNEKRFGMEEKEPLCRHEVPREGICIRIENDPMEECFKLKCNKFLFRESKLMNNGEVDTEMENTDY